MLGEIAVDWLLDPLALLFLLSLPLGATLAIGGSSRRRRRGVRAGRVLVFLAWIGAFLIASAPAIVNPLVAALETRHPADVACPAGTPLVVLGGGVDSRVREPDEFERMRPATLARAAAAERIARVEPGVPLVLSGGGLGGDASRVAEADVIARFLVSRGMDERRLLLETRSGDTAGNAREVAGVLAGAGRRYGITRAEGAVGRDGASVRAASGGKPGDRPSIRLVTSALHMPRALGTFRTAGLDACPVPIGPIALSGVPAWALMPQTTALVKFDALLHELVALAVYRLRGDL